MTRSLGLCNAQTARAVLTISIATQGLDLRVLSVQHLVMNGEE